MLSTEENADFINITDEFVKESRAKISRERADILELWALMQQKKICQKCRDETQKYLVRRSNYQSDKLHQLVIATNNNPVKSLSDLNKCDRQLEKDRLAIIFEKSGVYFPLEQHSELKPTMVKTGEYSPFNPAFQASRPLIGIGEYEERRRIFLEQKRREYLAFLENARKNFRKNDGKSAEKKLLIEDPNICYAKLQQKMYKMELDEQVEEKRRKEQERKEMERAEEEKRMQLEMREQQRLLDVMRDIQAKSTLDKKEIDGSDTKMRNCGNNDDSQIHNHADNGRIRRNDSEMRSLQKIARERADKAFQASREMLQRERNTEHSLKLRAEDEARKKAGKKWETFFVPASARINDTQDVKKKICEKIQGRCKKRADKYDASVILESPYIMATMPPAGPKADKRRPPSPILPAVQTRNIIKNYKADLEKNVKIPPTVSMSKAAKTEHFKNARVLSDLAEIRRNLVRRLNEE